MELRSPTLTKHMGACAWCRSGSHKLLKPAEHSHVLVRLMDTGAHNAGGRAEAAGGIPTRSKSCTVQHSLIAREFSEHACRRTRLERQLQRESLTEAERGSILSELEARERDITRLQRQRLCAEDFEPLTIIGRGAFGEVARLRITHVMALHGMVMS